MRVHKSGRRAVLAGSALAAALVLAACGQDQDGQSANTGLNASGPTSTAPTSTSSETTSDAPEPSTTTPAPAGANPPGAGNAELCKSADLTLALGDSEGAAGTVWQALRFTNESSAPCVIQGFPGVSYVAGDDGHQVGAAAYRDGTKGSAVTLSPGQTAYAAVGFSQVGNYDPDECEPTEVRGLRVYPPQETRSMYIAAPGRGCANENVSSYQLKVQTIRAGSGPA